MDAKKEVVLKSLTYEVAVKDQTRLSGKDAREALIQALHSIPESELKNIKGGHITVIL